MESNHKNIKICVVSPEIVGPVNNGGIGTHAFYLSKFLSEDLKYDTTVLFTDTIVNRNLDYWKSYYKSNWQIKFFNISEISSSFQEKIAGGCWLIRQSLDIYHWLRHQDFDICHFQDWQANGFVSIQAKRTGQAFKKTLLTCTTHSSSQWIREVMQDFSERGNQDLVLDYAERYCAEFADFVISPSEYMFNWATLRGWNLSNQKRVIPYLLEVNSSQHPEKQDNQQIIFFGRLETRKGIEVFLQSLKILEPEFKSKNHPVKITFLGKIGIVRSRKADEVVKEAFASLSDIYTCVLLNDYGHTEALDFLKQNSGALIVIPSLIDNFPFATLECVELGLNVIAANTGGIPEIFEDNNRLFEPNPQSLAEKIEKCIFGEIKPLKKKYSPELAKELWHEFHTSYLSEVQLNLDEKNRIKSQHKEPSVSVCICIFDFNRGEYLGRSLKSLARQTYGNLEVIVVNNSYQQALANDTFEEMKLLYKDRNWLFIEQSHSSSLKAKNFTAQQANGDYLIFMDADDVADSEAIEKIVKGILASGTDCLTCYFGSFKNESDITTENYQFAYVPIGACLEAGIQENVFGGSNFIINKEVFFQLDGFNEKGIESVANWEFFSSLLLAGYSLDVIPDYLILQQDRKKSPSNSSSFEQTMQVLAPYLSTMPFWQQRYLLNTLGDNSNIYQPLTTQELQLPPTVFKFLRSVYLRLSSGGLQNKSPNLLARFLNFIVLQITKTTRT